MTDKNLQRVEREQQNAERHEQGCSCGCSHFHDHVEKHHDHVERHLTHEGGHHDHDHDKEHHHSGENALSCGCEHCQEKAEKAISDKSKSIFSIYRFDFIKIMLSVMLIVLAFMVEHNIASLCLYVCAAIVCGYELAVNCFKNIIKGKIFDENTLMFIASVTAFCLGEYFEGAFIVTLFALGETLEGLATTNSRRKIAGLAELKSTVVHLIGKDGISDVIPEDVDVDSLIEIRKGERVPIDGVLMGTSVELDTKAVTGESKLAIVNNGEQVISGSINVGNAFVMKTSKLYKESTVERIIAMVEGATAKKAQSQKFITAFAKVYTPIIFRLAVIIAFIVPLFDGMEFIKWIYKSLSFLVVSCPCALVISVPLAFFVGIGSLAKNGILVKGSNCLESLAKVKVAVFDKTGTLTKGNFEIDKIETTDGFDQEEVLRLVNAVESKSNHPISKVITQSLSGIEKLAAIEVVEIVGKGLSGKVDDKEVLIGNYKLMQENNVCCGEVTYAGTVLYVALNGKFAQIIYLSDQLKSGSAESIIGLKSLGVTNTYMLSGDNKEVAEKLGKEVGIDKVYSELLPEDKLDIFHQISELSKGVTMYVGDGINDSPTLSTAGVGVAMGGLGSEIAVDSADVVIIDDDVRKLPVAIRYSKKIRRTVILNIVGSLVVKFSIMLLSLIIHMPIWIAMFGDVGVMLLAVTNSLLSAKVK